MCDNDVINGAWIFRPRIDGGVDVFERRSGQHQLRIEGADVGDFALAAEIAANLKSQPR